jgi:hypothetical protein
MQLGDGEISCQKVMANLMAFAIDAFIAGQRGFAHRLFLRFMVLYFVVTICASALILG